MPWGHILSGALTGLVVGLTGVGGGALMTPLLLLFFGVAPVTAVGTDLWFAAATKVVASRIHHGEGLIDWQVVRRLWLGSLTASGMTLLFLRFGPLPARADAFLKLAVAVAVLISALGMLLQKRLLAFGLRREGGGWVRFQGPLTIVAGGLLGVLVTLTSVGAGALGVVFLVFLYPTRLTAARLVATDVAHAIPLTLFAGSAHLIAGHVDWKLLASLLLGSVPAVILGAKLAPRLPQTVLRLLLAVLLLFIGIHLWMSVR
ncbi:MAG: sulfite exporter TauE/SafE family protein [Acidobacteria bacterium]|nr:sulfite exporter TauE/SafE family protein [Acidobacteriota bacterium]